MDDDTHEIEEANTSTNASPRQSCLTPRRQALADSMMESVKAYVSKLRPGDPPTIYKVPQIIRQEKEVAYEPQIVSIGPYHNGKEKLQAMEEHKWLYLHSFLSHNTKYKLEHYLKAMSEWEDEARSCYYDNVDLQVGNEFVKMMVLDACFIVELLLRFHQLLLLLEEHWEEFEENEEGLGLISAIDKFFLHSNGFKDPVLDSIRMVFLIAFDMLLLENQIPFFVLQRILEMAYPNKEPHFLAESALHLFDQIMTRNNEIQIKDSYHHLLHLFLSHLKPTLTHSKEEPNLSCSPKIKLKPNLSCNPKIKSVLNKYLKNLLIIFLPCSNKAPSPIPERAR
ncbi:UPF0481 protein At3g47200-like [Magnolia sinica]|uniref:UPF0481 protein At3g47200-like n=1 Tax=Magnolia sinica TaxID=86752 RepID=UPI00265AEC6A|nr:UPF0481 protein At3g47200-like [Magnolia sinica]